MGYMFNILKKTITISPLKQKRVLLNPNKKIRKTNKLIVFIFPVLHT